jgi:hypothetical protein
MNDMDSAAPLSRATSKPSTLSCCAHQSHAGGVSVTQHKVPCPADSCRSTEPGWWLKMCTTVQRGFFQRPGAGASLLCRGIESASAATAHFGKEKEAFVRWDRNSSCSGDVLGHANPLLLCRARGDARPLRPHQVSGTSRRGAVACGP